MQRHSRFGLFALILAGVMVGGLAVLATVNVPSPMKPIEKPLDAKEFLSTK